MKIVFHNGIIVPVSYTFPIYRSYVTRSQLPPKSFHVHPQKYRQRVILTDGSQVEWSCICPRNGVLSLIQDSAIHPSWNSSKLNHQQLLLDSFGSVSKFHKRFISPNPDTPSESLPLNSTSNSTSKQAADEWKALEKTFATFEQDQPISSRSGRLERQAMVDPEVEKKLAAIAASQKKKPASKKK